MSDRIPEWVIRYLSIPYEQVNCWDLVEKVYAAEYGIAIGGKSEQSQKMKSKEWVDVLMNGLGFLEGDVILFRERVMKKHVAILLTPNLMLHSHNPGTNSCIELWESAKWRSRVVSIYRHKSRCKSQDN